MGIPFGYYEDLYQILSRHDNLTELSLQALRSAPGLTWREGQARMLELVAGALSWEGGRKFAVVEAGTGIGKTLAYLIPLMLLTAVSDLRAAVATGTRALQDQLVKKDVPLAARIVEKFIGRRPTVAVLYGRKNYVCTRLLHRRLREVSERLPYAPDDERAALGREAAFLRHVVAWLEEGGSGLKDDLPPPKGGAVSGREAEAWWTSVSATDEDADCAICYDEENRLKEMWAKGLIAKPWEEISRFDKCPFRRARTALADADIVVANHHLVAVDFLLRERANFSLLSRSGEPVDVLVVDEAHDFADAFRSVTAASVSLLRWERLVADLRRFVAEVSKWAAEEAASLVTLDWAPLTLMVAEASAQEALTEAGELLYAAFTWAAAESQRAGGDGLILDHSYRPPADGLAEGLEEAFAECIRPLRAALEEVHERAEQAGAGGVALASWDLLGRCRRVERRCGEFVTAVRRAVLLENHYSSAGPGGDAVEFDGARFTAYPVDQSDVLRRLWEPYRNVVFTSATLFPAPHEAGLLWFCRRHGLEGGGVAADAVASPFRYAEQMKAFVLRDPDLYPSEVFVRGSGMYVQQEQRRRAKLAEAVLAAAGAARGGVMVLFTSREEMDAVADLVAGRVPPGRLLLVQGRDGGRSSLLKRFREHGRGLLFGLDSFWQGVDVPGDALQVLVIARLPFPNPRDPLVEARVRLAGDRKWEEVYRPEACMALRQGVGRLIRSESDKGAVVVADPRATKRHRRLLEEALPVGAEVVDGVPDLVAALNEFFTE